MTSSVCPFQDPPDLPSATTSNLILYPAIYFGSCIPNPNNMFMIRVRIGSWVSRLQVVARAEDADGKLIPIKSTANGEVKHMAR